mgnify:FL=1
MSNPRGADSATVSLANVAKAFGPTRALDGLDLHVEPGDAHGFLGPNGAGKTVTIRVLLGLLRADSGVARLFGADPWTDAVGSTGASLMSLGMSICGPGCQAARSSTCLGGCAVASISDVVTT